MILKICDLKNILDLIFLFQARSHSEVSKYLNGPPPESFDSHVYFLEKTHQKDRIIYLIEVDGLNVGYCQLRTSGYDQGEVGWVIHPDYQGRGFGNKSIELLVTKAKDLGFEFPHLYVKRENSKALSMYERFGFVEKWDIDGNVKMILQ